MGEIGISRICVHGHQFGSLTPLPSTSDKGLGAQAIQCLLTPGWFVGCVRVGRTEKSECTSRQWVARP